MKCSATLGIWPGGGGLGNRQRILRIVSPEPALAGIASW